jgi:hypothetical protein
MHKQTNKGLPKRLPEDTVAHLAAVDLLEALGVSFWRPSLHHLKVGDLNYWPASGKMKHDWETSCRRDRGKLALAGLIIEKQKVHTGFKAKRATEKQNRDAEQALRDAETPSCRHSEEVASLTTR